MKTLLLAVVWRKDPGMSALDTSPFSFAAIAQVIKTDSTAAVGEEVSCLVLYTL